MILPDVNVLIYAFRDDSIDHQAYRDWLEISGSAPEPLGVSELVLSAFIRIVTNRRVFARPTGLATALAFAGSMRAAPNAIVVRPGARHWDIFDDLLTRTGTTGVRVSDAYLAALAIETDSEFITADHDFSRFPGLRWRHPLRPA